jgi:hypothetical protein
VKDRKEVIRVEILKLLAGGFIREFNNLVWLAIPVLVPKKTSQWRMCINYTDLNRHYPKDPFPLPRIDPVVDSIAGSTLLLRTRSVLVVDGQRVIDNGCWTDSWLSAQV